ncbi:MAG: alpha/beta superfamily hydrolase/acyltransferase, partial [uncultured bacterium]
LNKKNNIKFLTFLLKPFFKWRLMKGLKQFIYKKIGAEDYIATPQLKETFLNIINENLEDCLSEINQKTLIVWGENDKDTPLEFAKIMHQKIKNSKLKIIKEAGHFSFLDKPKEFCQELLNFIR